MADIIDTRIIPNGDTTLLYNTLIIDCMHVNMPEDENESAYLGGDSSQFSGPISAPLSKTFHKHNVCTLPGVL